ncbi:MAG: hypothetical protein JO356_17970 [Acidobacteria bacterium]|nr:hypothetical protein [Acidobacteriota bacterium]
MARVNDELRILEHEDDPLQKEGWSVLASCPRACEIRQSPTRRTISVYNSDAIPPLTIIQAAQPPIIKRCGKVPRQIRSADDSIQNYPQAITDKFAYFSGSFALYGPFSYRWPLCDYEHRVEMEPPLKGGATPLGDELFIASGDKDLEVVTSNSQVKFRQSMSKHESWSRFWVPLRSSESGDRVAVDMLTTRGGKEVLDISIHVTARRIAVYDIEAGKEVASIPVNAKHNFHYEFDLSPDGHRLAVLEDSTVKIVDLSRSEDLSLEHADAPELKDRNLRLQVPVVAPAKPKP